MYIASQKLQRHICLITTVPTRLCHVPSVCPVDGGWSSWYMEKNESCSVTCGGGEMNVTYRRRCDSPSPQYGGSDCTGDDIRVDTVVCNTQPCPSETLLIICHYVTL